MKNHELIDFKVGDLVVYINSIAPGDPRLFEITEIGSPPDAWSIRHATPSEIARGMREDLK